MAIGIIGTGSRAAALARAVEASPLGLDRLAAIRPAPAGTLGDVAAVKQIVYSYAEAI